MARCVRFVPPFGLGGQTGEIENIKHTRSIRQEESGEASEGVSGRVTDAVDVLFFLLGVSMGWAGLLCSVIIMCALCTLWHIG